MDDNDKCQTDLAASLPEDWKQTTWNGYFYHFNNLVQSTWLKTVWSGGCWLRVVLCTLARR